MKTIKIISENILKKNYFLKSELLKLQDSHALPVDTLNRKLTDVRISLIDKCNFRCSYCMPKSVFGKNYKFLSKKELLSFDEIFLISSAFINLGVEKIRLTGGEPLLRKKIEQLIFKLKDLKTLKNDPVETAITTNGALLYEKADLLLDAGLKRITVSLDSLNQKIFESMSDTNISVQKILKGIEHAKKIGLGIKVNMVVKKGLNESQIIPMAKYFKKNGITLRFIEFMDVGSSNSWQQEKVISSQEILTLLNQEFKLNYIGRDNISEVSEKWRYSGSDSEIGLISSVSKPFCSNCSRARISADGFLYTCLFASSGTDLKPIIRCQDKKSEKSDSKHSEQSEKDLVKFIDRIWRHRSDRYSDLRFVSSKKTKSKKIEMSYIGG